MRALSEFRHKPAGNLEVGDWLVLHPSLDTAQVQSLQDRDLNTGGMVVQTTSGAVYVNAYATVTVAVVARL